MIYFAAVAGYAAAVIGFCWVWSKRPPPSMAEIQAENAEQMAWLAARSRHQSAKAAGHTRGQGAALIDLRDAMNARLRAGK